MIAYRIRGLARVAAAGLLAAAGLAMAAAAPPATAQSAATSCREVTVATVLPDGTPAPIAGTLCVPSGATAVAVLVPGISYARAYWDFDYRPKIYSAARAANTAGFATFALDRLGTGRSAHPVSAEVTLSNQAATVHQVIQALRRGDLGAAFGHVGLVGHSYGSIVSYTEAGLYPGDVDALVTTGITHRLNLADALAGVVLPSRPAALDPAFAARHLDPGYLTTPPGGRRVFYDTATADPAVIAHDEATKDVYSAFDIATYGLDYLAASSARANNIPVLVVDGQDDHWTCGPPAGADCSTGATLAAHERPFYGPAATVAAAVVPDTGHDIALHPSAPDSTRVVLDWLRGTLPAAGHSSTSAPSDAEPLAEPRVTR